jgi:hypothetical protein
MTLIAIIALGICAGVIALVVRIYKESPRITKNIERDDLLN